MNYRQTGGLRIGEINLTYPFAKISATQNSIEIKSTFKAQPYKFEKDSIVSLKKYTGFLSSGLQIEHNQNSTPSCIVFWSFNLSELISELRKMEYSITE